MAILPGASCHSHNSCALFGRVGRIVDEYRPRGLYHHTLCGSITGGTDLEIRVRPSGSRQVSSLSFPSGRNTPCRIRIASLARPSPDSQGKSVPLAALTLQFRLRSFVQRSIRRSSVYTSLLLLRAGCFDDPVSSMIPSRDQQQYCHAISRCMTS